MMIEFGLVEILKQRATTIPAMKHSVPGQTIRSRLSFARQLLVKAEMVDQRLNEQFFLEV